MSPVGICTGIALSLRWEPAISHDPAPSASIAVTVACPPDTRVTGRLLRDSAGESGHELISGWPRPRAADRRGFATRADLQRAHRVRRTVALVGAVWVHNARDRPRFARG